MKSEAQGEQGTGLPSTLPPGVQNSASPAGCVDQGRVWPVGLQRRAPGQGPRPGCPAGEARDPAGRPVWAAVAEATLQKDPWLGSVGIWPSALSSRNKSRFFPGRAREASLGHGAVQPKNVRDFHIRNCALFTVGLYSF